MIISSLLSTYQVAALALGVKDALPTATTDQIGSAIDFVATMIEDLEEDEAAEYVADLQATVNSVVDHIQNVLFNDAWDPAAEGIAAARADDDARCEATYVDLVA